MKAGEFTQSRYSSNSSRAPACRFPSTQDVRAELPTTDSLETKGVQMIENSIQLGDPVEYRCVVMAPIFPREDPIAEYLMLEEALPLGFRITEVDAAGSVPELLAFNPLDTPVLLYDGEELLRAKQNRILNVTVLVAAKGETRIPVSCVEQVACAERQLRLGAAHRIPGP